MQILGLYNGQNSVAGTSQQIGAVTSADGGATPMTKVAGNPVILLGAPGDFDSQYAAIPEIFTDGVTLFGLYSGFNGGNWAIGLVTATDINGPWTKHGAVLSPGGGWDAGNVYYPTVLYDATEANAAKRVKVWYLGNDGGGTWGVGYAYAASPLTGFTKFGVAPVITPSGVGWEGSIIEPGVITKEGSTFYLTGDGYNANGTVATGLFTFTDPEGAYTRNGGNPLISPQTTVTAVLSANANAGVSTITVPSTAVFTAGQSLIVYDSLAFNKEAVRLLSKTPTTLTFYAPLANSYTTARGATVVSVALNKVSLRGLFKDGATYRGLLTCFGAQPEQFELVIWVTAAALTGPWSYDYTRGLAITPGTGSDFDRTSAENLSVITIADPVPVPGVQGAVNMAYAVFNKQIVPQQNITVTTHFVINLVGLDAISLQPIYTDATPVVKSFVAANVSVGADTITITAHGFSTGLKVALAGTNLPTGLSATNYYAIVVDVNTIKLATSAANAIAGTAVDITGAGSTADATLTPASLSFVVKLQASNDQTNWIDVSGDTVSITSAGTVMWTVAQPPYAYLNVVCTATSGVLGLKVQGYGQRFYASK